MLHLGIVLLWFGSYSLIAWLFPILLQLDVTDWWYDGRIRILWNFFLPSTHLIIRAFPGVASYFTTLNMNNVDTCVLEESALCIVVLPRKGLHLLSTNSVLFFAVHFKTGCFHSKLYFDNPNWILKPIVFILYFILAPQIENKLRNPKPSFHLRFSIVTFYIHGQFLHSKSPIHFAFQKRHFGFRNWD